VKSNRAMPLVDERCLQPDLLGTDRIVPVASIAASRDLDASSSTPSAATTFTSIDRLVFAGLYRLASSVPSRRRLFWRPRRSRPGCASATPPRVPSAPRRSMGSSPLATPSKARRDRTRPPAQVAFRQLPQILNQGGTDGIRVTIGTLHMAILDFLKLDLS
jgi:hypothetical protein